jgi:hypothetical protein
MEIPYPKIQFAYKLPSFSSIVVLYYDDFKWCVSTKRSADGAEWLVEANDIYANIFWKVEAYFICSRSFSYFTPFAHT